MYPGQRSNDQAAEFLNTKERFLDFLRQDVRINIFCQHDFLTKTTFRKDKACTTKKFN